jgi:hypothetical protein
MKEAQIENNHEAIKDYLENLDDESQVNIHNTFCQENNYGDDIIEFNDDEFFEVHFTKPIDAVRAAQFGEYNFTDTFVKFNGYANLESFNNPEEHIDISAITKDIQENPEIYDIELVFYCPECGIDHTDEEDAEDCCKDDEE